jgi:hypothetical protein
MTSRARLVTVLVIVGFIAFLLYATIEVQRVECTVTVDFQGKRRTATASGATEESATGHGRDHRLLAASADRPPVPPALSGR